MIPVWTERNIWVKNFIPDNSSVIDWGCGDKDILRYISPSKYIGIDINPKADIIADFNIKVPKLFSTYDIGLVLGVLEYLNDPEYFLRSIKPTANKFLILTLPSLIKPSWKQSFTDRQIESLLSKIWTNISTETDGQYLLNICTK